jgi:hypothetical protein
MSSSIQIKRKGKHGRASAALLGEDMWRCLVIGVQPRGVVNPAQLRVWMSFSLRLCFPERLSVDRLTELLDTPRGKRYNLPLWQTQACARRKAGSYQLRDELTYCTKVRAAVLAFHALVVKHNEDWLLRWESASAGWGVVWGANAASEQAKAGAVIRGLVGIRRGYNVSATQLAGGKSSLVSSSSHDSEEDQWKGGAVELSGPLSYVNSGCADCCTAETIKGFTGAARLSERTYADGERADPMAELFNAPESKAGLGLVGTFISFQYSNDGHYTGDIANSNGWCRRCIARQTLESLGTPALQAQLKRLVCGTDVECETIVTSFERSDSEYTIQSDDDGVNKRNLAKWILFYGGSRPANEEEFVMGLSGNSPISHTALSPNLSSRLFALLILGHRIYPPMPAEIWLHLITFIYMI